MTFKGKYNSYSDLVESTIGSETRKTLLEIAFEIYLLLCSQFEITRLDKENGVSLQSQLRMGGNGF